MNMSKYSTLANSELIPSKMAKLQGFEKHLLWRHTDVIEAFNLEIYNYFKNLHQNTQLAKFELLILKNTKVTRPSMFLIMTSLWLHKSLEFENI